MFDNCPDEIVGHVLSYLTGKELLDVSLVCKRWHRVSLDGSANRFLFHVKGSKEEGPNLDDYNSGIGALENATRPITYLKISNITVEIKTDIAIRA